MKNELAKILSDVGIERQKAESIWVEFEPYFESVNAAAEKVDGLDVTDVSQREEMALARDTRIELKRLRVAAGKTKKHLKDSVLKEGRFIDAAYNLIADATRPVEDNLLNMELFAKRAETERKAKLKAKRESELHPLGVDTQFMDLENMDEVIYEALLGKSEKAYEDRIEAERLEAEMRAEREKAEAEERARIQEENERLRKEREEQERVEAERAIAKRENERAEEAERKALREDREAALEPFDIDTRFLDLENMTGDEFAELIESEQIKHEAAERERIATAKAEKERQRQLAEERAKREAAEAEARREREQREAEERARRKEELRKEREERERLELALAAKEAAEQAERERIDAESQAAEAERQRIAQASDKEKLEAYMRAITSVETPVIKSDQAQNIILDFCGHIDTAISKIEKL